MTLLKKYYIVSYETLIIFVACFSSIYIGIYDVASKERDRQTDKPTSHRCRQKITLELKHKTTKQKAIVVDVVFLNNSLEIKLI